MRMVSPDMDMMKSRVTELEHRVDTLEKQLNELLPVIQKAYVNSIF